MVAPAVRCTATYLHHRWCYDSALPYLGPAPKRPPYHGLLGVAVTYEELP